MLDYSRISKSTVARLEPSDLRHYLIVRGWKRIDLPDKKDAFAVFRRDKNDDHIQEVIVPLNPDEADFFYRRMVEAVHDLSEYEERSMQEVLLDLTSTDEDILECRLVDPFVEDGTIPIDHGIRLISGMRKAFMASACAAVSPQKYYPRLSFSNAVELLDQCRLSTSPGSFIARLSCPLTVDDHPQISLYQEADTLFGRRTTQTLMNSLYALVRYTDRDQLDTLEDESEQFGLNANLCDALLDMEPTSPQASLTISSRWSPSHPREDPEAPTHISLRKPHFQAAQAMANTLRPKRGVEESMFIGTVDGLNGVPDEDGVLQGTVTLRLRDGDDLILARADLKAADYRIAGQAHMNNTPINISGTLQRRSRIHRVTDYESFRLLEVSHRHEEQE